MTITFLARFFVANFFTWCEKEKKLSLPKKTILIQNVVNIVLLYVSVGVVVSNFFFAIVLFQKTANELCLGGSYGSLGFAKKMYLNTFLDSRTTVFLV